MPENLTKINESQNPFQASEPSKYISPGRGWGVQVVVCGCVRNFVKESNTILLPLATRKKMQKHEARSPTFPQNIGYCF